MERVPFTTQLEQKYERGLAERLIRYTVCLYAEGKDRPQACGTGTLLRIENSHFMITAAHITDNALKCAFGVGGFIENRERIPIFDVDVTPSEMPASNRRLDDPIDVALVPLKRQVVKQLSLEKQFLTLSDLNLENYSNQDLFMTIGLPIDSEKWNSAQRNLSSEIYYSLGIRHGENAGIIPNFNPDKHIGVTYRNEERNLVGMSGCGVWLVGRRGGACTLDKAELVAHTRIQNKEMHIFECTKIGCALYALHRTYASLRDAIDKQFPNTFVAD